MSAIYRLFTEHLGGQNSSTFISRVGEAWFDTSVNEIRISDGVTPGGKPITITSLAANSITLNGVSSDSYTFDDISFSADGFKNTFPLTYNQQKVTITSPYNLDVSVNGLTQNPFVAYSNLMWQSLILPANKGFSLDSLGKIKFSSSVPRGSNIIIRTRFGSIKSTNNIYPFKPLDIMMG
jgi:hypothetical protein